MRQARVKWITVPPPKHEWNCIIHLVDPLNRYLDLSSIGNYQWIETDPLQNEIVVPLAQSGEVLAFLKTFDKLEIRTETSRVRPSPPAFCFSWPAMDLSCLQEKQNHDAVYEIHVDWTHKPDKLFEFYLPPACDAYMQFQNVKRVKLNGISIPTHVFDQQPLCPLQYDHVVVEIEDPQHPIVVRGILFVDRRNTFSPPAGIISKDGRTCPRFTETKEGELWMKA
jgi:hypothetical protein